MGRSPNTISYELKHLAVSGEYVARKASVKAYQKRYYARTSSNKVAQNEALREYVDNGLDKGWSPGEIAGSNNCPVSKRTIYRYVTLYALQHKLYFKREAEAAQSDVPTRAHWRTEVDRGANLA